MRKYVTGLIALLLVLFYCASCGPSYHLRRAEHHIQKAKDKGADVDVTKTTRTDSVTFIGFRDRKEQARLADPVVLNELCVNFVSQVRKDAKRKVAEKIADVVCPEINFDSTYQFKITAQGEEYFLPVHVSVRASGGEHEFFINAPDLDLAVIVEENKTEISSGYTLWDLVILCAVVAVVAYILGMFRKNRIVG